MLDDEGIANTIHVFNLGSSQNEKLNLLVRIKFSYTRSSK